MISCYHIVIKHTKSRNPHDRFRNKPVTRTPTEAEKICEELWAELSQLSGAQLEQEFRNLAYNYSECGSAAQ